MNKITKRLALVGAIAAAMTLSACTSGGPTGPTITPSNTPTPTATAGPVAPPESEDEAIDAATTVLNQSLIVRGEVNAAGGTDTARYDSLMTGPALQKAQQEAALTVENGDVTSGAVTIEIVSAYAAEWEGTEFGLVTLPTCTDFSTYVINTSDGSPAPRPDNLQIPVDYQVVYVEDAQAWKVYDTIVTGDTC